MRAFLLLSLLLSVGGAGAATTVEGVSFADKVTVAGNPLTLNGAGLRTKRVLMMDFKVYAAALYAPKATADADALMATVRPLELKLVFLRKLGRGTLVDAWKEGLAKNCAADCAQTSAALERFNAAMTDVKTGDSLRIDFYKGRTEARLTVKGTERDAVSIDGAEFSHGLMAVFIGAHPPTEELKKGLLGQN